MNQSDNQIVIHVDGGICSQLSFVAMGRVLEAVSGLSVKYDLSWYETCGTDNDRRFARNWDFPKAFPSLAVKVATEAEIASARKSGVITHGYLNDIRAPAYIASWPDKDVFVVKAASALRQAFDPVLDEASRQALAAIGKSPSCAVHVRRGDLARHNAAYGDPTSTDYFVRCVRMVHGLDERASFFFFSDEPDYVESEIMPHLPHRIDCQVMRGNGSDRGYLDLFLMSRCRYVISSQGSMGGMAAILGPTVGTLFTPVRKDVLLAGTSRVVYVNEDRFAALPIDAYVIKDGGNGSAKRVPVLRRCLDALHITKKDERGVRA